MYEPTKKEQKESVKKLIKFCKKDLTNYCLMYSYMLTIKQIRKEPEDKILEKKLKKQAEDYKNKTKNNQNGNNKRNYSH